MITSTSDLARSLATPSPPPRYDPMAQFADAPQAPVNVREGVRTFWAFGLVAAGVGVIVWLVWLMHVAVFRPHAVGLLDRITPTDPSARVLTLPAGRVELPPALFNVIAYVFLLLLTTIAARIGALTMREGVSLLHREPAPENTEGGTDLSLPPLDSHR